jgi:hypothetical protein
LIDAVVLPSLRSKKRSSKMSVYMSKKGEVTIEPSELDSDKGSLDGNLPLNPELLALKVAEAAGANGRIPSLRGSRSSASPDFLSEDDCTVVGDEASGAMDLEMALEIVASGLEDLEERFQNLAADTKILVSDSKANEGILLSVAKQTENMERNVRKLMKLADAGGFKGDMSVRGQCLTKFRKTRLQFEAYLTVIGLRIRNIKGKFELEFEHERIDRYELFIDLENSL